MKDASTILRTAYVTGLATVTYNTVPVEVFSFVPYQTATPYIYLSDVTFNEEGTKTRFIHNLTILIDIGAEGANGKNIVDDISNQVLQLATSKTGGFTLNDDFKIMNGILESANYLNEDTENSYVTRKLLRIRHLIYESSVV